MSKWILLLGFLCSAILPLSAQMGFSYFEEGQTYYLWGDAVNVRKSASASAESIEKLAVATPVKVLKVTDKTHKSSGWEGPWVEVSYSSNGQNRRGFVWAGLISPSSVETSGGLRLLFGLKGPSKKEGEMVGELRMVRNGQIVDKSDYPFFGSPETAILFEDLGDKGLNKVKKVISLDISNQFCGGGTTTYFFFDFGSSISRQITTRSMSDIPVFAHETLIFPKDEGGKANRILLHEQVGEYDDDGNPNYSTDKTTVYEWNGTTLKRN